MNQFIETPNSHRQVIQKPYHVDPEEVKDNFKNKDPMELSKQLKEADLQELVSMFGQLPQASVAQTNQAQPAAPLGSV